MGDRHTVAIAGASPKANDSTVNDDTLCLRKNFGLPDWATRTFLTSGGVGRRALALSWLPLTPFLKIVFHFVRRLPWTLKSVIALKAWWLWVRVHRLLPSTVTRRGISDGLSIEAHAMHNVLWWGRLFPMPLWTMRFALSQLSVSYPPTTDPEWVNSPETPGLRSAYLRLSSPLEAKPRVLLWAFGGAFVSGDVEGNRGLAEHYGRMLGCDVFLVDMRLCPENTVQDAVLDLYRGYEWLLQRVPAENIVMLGISSGGGSCMRMLQLAGSDDAARRSYFGGRTPLPPSLPQPAGTIVLGAFVEYTKNTKSMEENTSLDWVVSPSVLEMMSPMRDTLCGGIDNLQICSPVHQDMKGICPLYISVSEHECLIDEDLQLARNATNAGVDVALSTRPFQCHVYQLFSRFLPEAAEEEARICDWVRARGGVWA
jgi:acetyl esterase/lipase